MTRWFVQIEARFASVWPYSVEVAVAERLDRLGLLAYGDRDNGILGDPGPILCATLVIEAADAEAAAEVGWRAYSDVLDASGAVGYAHEGTVTRSMAEMERRLEESCATMDEWLAWVDAGENLPDHLIVGRDSRRTESSWLESSRGHFIGKS